MFGGKKSALSQCVLRVWDDFACRRFSGEIWHARVVSRTPGILNQRIFCAYTEICTDHEIASRVNRKVSVLGDDWIGVIAYGPDDEICVDLLAGR